MKYIEKLLNGAEVKWMPLGEVAELKRGATITKKTSSEGRYPVISGGQQPAYYIDKFNRDGETITVAGSGAYAGFVMYWNEPIFVSDAFSIKADETRVLSRYIFHYLLNIQDKIHELKAGGGVPHVYAKDVARFLMPIPCPDNPKKSLDIQRKLVDILDKFTTLEAELEAELDCRKRQYEYYRNQLLSFDMLKRGGQKLNNIEMMTLGEMCSVQRGKRLTKRDLNHNGRYPVFHGGIEPIGYYSSSNREANSVMVINVGASAGTVGYSSKEFWSSDGCFCFSHCEQLNQKYLFYALQSMENSIKGQVRKAGIPTLDNKVVEKLKIPIPSLAEQQRIVSILDKFEALTTSISEGLPKEIALRRKQYEYYRNQLLSFA